LGLDFAKCVNPNEWAREAAPPPSPYRGLKLDQ